MSSSVNEQASSPQRAMPLGRLLIARGLLTEEQLIEGLLEQDRTGDRLGQVLIRLGFVDPPNVAMALASQHGGPLKTEYGFAMGFDPPAEPVPEPQSELRLAGNPDADPAEREDADGESPTEPTSEEAESASDISASSTTAEPAPTEADLDAAHMRIAGLEGELVAEREQLDERHAKIVELEEKVAGDRLAAAAELDAAQTRIAGLEAELAVAREHLDERRTRIAELEDRVTGARLAAETAITALHAVADAST